MSNPQGPHPAFYTMVASVVALILGVTIAVAIGASAGATDTELEPSAFWFPGLLAVVAVILWIVHLVQSSGPRK